MKSPSNPTNSQKPLCDGAWAIPPSPLMLTNGNDYYTCSKCGGKCDPPANTASNNQSPDELDRLVVRLIKESVNTWLPPTYEELSDLIRAYTTSSVREARIDEVQRIPNPAYIGDNGLRCEPNEQYKIKRIAELETLSPREE